MRIEIDTKDFDNLPVAINKGYYRKKCFCTNCDLLISTETWDSVRMFSLNTILKDNKVPNYCPNCGVQIQMNIN